MPTMTPDDSPSYALWRRLYDVLNAINGGTVPDEILAPLAASVDTFLAWCDENAEAQRLARSEQWEAARVAAIDAARAERAAAETAARTMQINAHLAPPVPQRGRWVPIGTRTDAERDAAELAGEPPNR